MNRRTFKIWTRTALLGAALTACSGAEAPADHDERPVPGSSRAALDEALAAVIAALPAPAAPYRHDLESSSDTVEAVARWNSSARKWSSPAAGFGERVYRADAGKAAAAPDLDRTLEVRVFLNAEPALPSGLASVGGEPRLFELEGAPAVEVTTIGAEGGRVAIPLSAEQAANALTVIRVYVGPAAMDRAVRSLLAEDRSDPAPVLSPTPRAGDLQTLVVELYGTKRDVERLARRIDLGRLRKLLGPA